MADDRHYIPGSFYRLDERTGFKVRAEKTKREWTGRIVRDQSWEARQPQDFVRGVRDDQTVPDPRPRQLPWVFIGVGDFMLVTDLGKNLGNNFFVNRYDLLPTQQPPSSYIPGSNSGFFYVYTEVIPDPAAYPASNGSQGEGTY